MNATSRSVPDLRATAERIPLAGKPVERSPRWRLPWGALAIAVLALAGAITFFYPATAAWFSQYDQSKVVVDLQAATTTAGSSEASEALAAARAYNSTLISGGMLESNARKPIGVASGDRTSDQYNHLLRGNAAGAMGRLLVSKIDVDLPIYHGTSDETLAKGVGHLEGTSLPVGGSSQHSVLTAHRGLASATLFDHLDRLAIGDSFQVVVFGETLSYRVIETKVVAPEDTESLYARDGKDLVTLVTCTPLGVNTHRILVTGERIIPTPVADVQQASAAPVIPGAPWWALGLGTTVLVLGAYVWFMGRPTRADT